MNYDLKKIQKKLESVFDIKFHNDTYVDKKCIKNITNRCELILYIGRYVEGVTPEDKRDHISFSWMKTYGDYHGMGRGFYTVDEVVKQLDKLGYPRRLTAEPEQLSLF